MKSGILIVNKEKNMTSRDVVDIAVKKLSTKKIGHTGTLDPIAEGVLVLGVNEGTKIIELLTSNDKEYIATLELGYLTDSLDTTGNIVEVNNNFNRTDEEIKEALFSFLGHYMQEVPKYSAVKVNGKKLYQYARRGEEINLPKRDVEIKDIELLNIERNEKVSVTFRVHVSKGTYIRSLIRDIGYRLNTYATMSALKRTKQGIFSLDDAISIGDISSDKLITIADALSNLDKIILDNETCKKVKNGCKLDLKLNDYTLMMDKDNNLLAIYYNSEGIARSYRVFGGNYEEN